jgi:amino acid permease
MAIQMAAWLPLPSGFTGYATRFAHPALGFALGWNYWFKVRRELFLSLWYALI